MRHHQYTITLPTASRLLALTMIAAAIAVSIGSAHAQGPLPAGTTVPTAPAAGPAVSGQTPTVPAGEMPAAVAGTTVDGEWVAARFMITYKAQPADKWIADAFRKYGNKGFDAKGLGIVYQVFETMADTRTIVALGYGEGCDISANGSSGISASQCPVTTITLYADGRVNSRTSRPGCYVWVPPKTEADDPDPKANAVYMRYKRQSNTIQVISVIDGKPQSGCGTTVHP